MRAVKMKRIFFLLLLMVPVVAQTQTQTQGLESTPAPARNLSLARIITTTEQAGECISPLAVTRIDSELATVSYTGFEIQPGIHSLNGRATMKMESCP